MPLLFGALGTVLGMLPVVWATALLLSLAACMRAAASKRRILQWTRRCSEYLRDRPHERISTRIRSRSRQLFDGPPSGIAPCPLR